MSRRIELPPDRPQPVNRLNVAQIERAGFAGIDQVQVAVVKSVARATPLRVPEVRRMMAQMVRKASRGRGGLPVYVVELMHEDYQRLGSLSKTAKLWDRSRQSMWQIFSSHGLQMNSRNLQPRVIYRGRFYTPGKNGYYRDTVEIEGKREPLHHRIWQDLTGRKIPDGWQVFFKDGDCSNFSRSNLGCLPVMEVTQWHSARLRKTMRWTNRGWRRRDSLICSSKKQPK